MPTRTTRRGEVDPRNNDRERSYGNMYGMRKTTGCPAYLPEELKASLARMAEEQKRSEAELIREAIEAAVSSRKRPRPRIPLTGKGLGDSNLSEHVDRFLEGFGSS